MRTLVALDPAHVAAARVRFATALLRLSDGDPMFTDTLRGWLWADYCAAGAPFGLTEDGLCVWCDDSKDEALNEMAL